MKAVILEGDAVNPGDISWEPVTEICSTTVFRNTTEVEKWERLTGADAVFVNKVKIDEEVFEKFPQVKYVGVCATGYNVIDLEAAKRHGVTVTYVPAYSTPAVVQHTWGLILELACKIKEHDDSVKRGDWIKSDTFTYWLSPIIELENKTIGIYGYGNIGRRVAEIALSFGMKVLVCTKHPEKYKDSVPSIEFVSSEDLFKKSDIISLHAPLTTETEGIINEDTLQLCKDGVLIINVARGGLVNEEALYDALNNGKVGGAAVDVISEEPMREGNPLLKASNIIITPHIAWASKEARERLVAQVAENFKCFIEGSPINIAE
ncbi:MAG: D-2-hydroxyacid dehydrogenase [Lachnospiraceae bacterium]|nr:D-2-hydroxyacid dehydrogenase [Lachnospiraceae bacterium]